MHSTQGFQRNRLKITEGVEFRDNQFENVLTNNNEIVCDGRKFANDAKIHEKVFNWITIIMFLSMGIDNKKKLHLSFQITTIVISFDNFSLR